jgi:hypothetical protein
MAPADLVVIATDWFLETYEQLCEEVQPYRTKPDPAMSSAR